MRKMFSKKQVEELAKESIESVSSGSIDSAIGLNSSGKLVKGSISGGTQLYKHHVVLEVDGGEGTSMNVIMLSTKSSALSSKSNISFVIGADESLCIVDVELATVPTL